MFSILAPFKSPTTVFSEKKKGEWFGKKGFATHGGMADTKRRGGGGDWHSGGGIGSGLCQVGSWNNAAASCMISC